MFKGPARDLILQAGDPAGASDALAVLRLRLHGVGLPGQAQTRRPNRRGSSAHLNGGSTEEDKLSSVRATLDATDA